MTQCVNFRPVITLAQLLALSLAATPALAGELNDFGFDETFHYGYTWQHCERGFNSATLPKSPNDRSCIPDTLYSWQDHDKVREWMDDSTPYNVLPVRYLYT